MEPIRVLLVSRNVLFGCGVSMALSQEKDMEIVGETGDKEEAFSLVKELLPNAVIVDTKSASLSGFELASRIRRYCPAVAVITIAGSQDDDELYFAIRAGAAAHFSSEVTAEELVDAIREASQGKYPINEYFLTNPKVASRVLDQFQYLSSTMGKEIESLLVPLSSREIEILQYVAHGNSNKRIARTLGIKEQSVKNHVSSILRKLAANDRAHAVFVALQRGWINVK